MTPIPKGPLSALVCNYRPISITPVLSKVFERMIALRFGRFFERSGVLPSHQYSYRKRLGTCDALLDIVCAGQLELDRGGELALLQIDFSAAFDRVNHGGLVFKLREAGVGGLILKVFQNFLISDWCSRWGMLVNPSKTRGVLISRSRTVEPLFPDLLIDGSVVEMVSELKILGVILDNKLSFEKQVRAIAASASMRVGILRKTMSVFRDVTVRW